MRINLTAATTLYWAAYGPAVVRRFHGYNAQGSDLYIQFHEVPPLAGGTLTAGAVPATKSFVAQAGFVFDSGDIRQNLNECLIAVSSTEVNYTAVAGGSGLDASFEIDSIYDPHNPSTAVVIGDLTTPAEGLEVWTDAAASSIRRLLRLTYYNGEAATSYLQIYADGAATTGYVPLVGWNWEVATLTTLDLTFGPVGIPIYSKGAKLDSDGGVKHYGCLALGSSTAATLTPTTGGASFFRAIYI